MQCKKEETNDILSGPVMLLELCDTTLKEWLSFSSTMSADMLEDILIFALNIARGVEFLHSQEVQYVIHEMLHRRIYLFIDQYNVSYMYIKAPAAQQGYKTLTIA